MANFIHETAIIGPNVKLGDNNQIGPYCVLTGKVQIGNGNVFVSHVSVGQPAQHRKSPIVPGQSNDERGTVYIGDNNVFREFVTVHQPYITETRIGSEGYFMAYAHISHDTLVEDGVTVANNVQIGGHSVLMKNCNLGLSAVLHQFTVIGSYTMLGMGSVTSKHLIPFSKFVGSPTSKRIGLNKIGLERLGFTEENLQAIDEWSKQYLTTSEGVLDHPKLKAEVERYEAYVSERSH